ncbi:MAG TPA: hypothetical protein VG095_09455 [Chthoniobacterales bacterium]|nr:hypothetical protein [Chthoniobacterales bacterium]
MRIRLSILATISASLLTISPAGALTPEANRLVDDLERALRKTEEKPRQVQPRNGETQSFSREFVTRLRLVLASGGGNVEEMLNSVRYHGDSDEIAKICDALLSAVRNEREAKEAAFVSEVDASCKRAGDLLLKAQTATDLDPVLVELSRLRDQQQRAYSEVGRRATARAEATIRFVTRWQDYLVQLSVGNEKAAREKLTSLADDTSFPVVPRSEILARLNPLPTPTPPPRADVNTPAVEAIMLRIATLEDVAAAVKELRPLRQGANPVDFEAINELIMISNEYEQTKAGLPVSLAAMNGMHYRRFPKLRSEFVLLLLPQHLRALERKPAKGESGDEYLKRLGREAKEAGDWPLLLRVLETSHSLLTTNTVAPPEIAALKAFIAGENQYAAGQFSLAVTSYQTALRDGGNSVPAQAIGGRLKHIQANHAKAYEEGLERYRNPASANANLPPFPITGFRLETLPSPSPEEVIRRERRSPPPKR